MSFVNLFWMLLPSFLTNHILRKHSATTTRNNSASRVSVLDGLRGLACLVVFNVHYTYIFTRSFQYGYGVEGRTSLIQRPFLQLFWSGHAMVTIFFVTSGYGLSYKPLQAIQEGKLERLQTLLSSAAFRRPFRLYFPTFAALFLWAVSVQLGIFRSAKEIYESDVNFLHLRDDGDTPLELSSFVAQLTDLAQNSIKLLNVWDWWDNTSAADHYDNHTWTIAVELRCSMLLFLVIMATARMKQAGRTFCILAFIGFCIISDQIESALYLTGLTFAELDVRKCEGTSNKATDAPSVPGSRTDAPLSTTTQLLIFIAGIYLASAPLFGCATTPGFVTLYKISPSSISEQDWFIRSLGAVAITWTALSSTLLRPLFVNPFSLYMGKISFAVYLMHGNIIKSLGYVTVPHIFTITGVEDIQIASKWQLTISWFLGLLVLLPITIWVADLFWRLVDIPCVRSIRWMEIKSLTERNLGHIKDA